MAKFGAKPFGGMSKMPEMPKGPAAVAVKKSRAPARIAKPRGGKMARLAGIKI